MTKFGDFIGKYTLPWRLEIIDRESPGGETYERIVDARGEIVVRSIDADEYESGFSNEIDDLIEAMNSLVGSNGSQ